MGAIVAVVVVVLVVVVGVAAVISSRSDSSEVASGDTSTTAAPTDPLGPPPTAPGTSTVPTPSPTTSTTTAPPATAPPPTTLPAPAPPGGVPSGLLCRDLAARGLSYDAAVAYWFQEGQPDRMDEDLNGIPCETVYSAGEIASVFPDDPGGAPPGVPSGLLCRDLAARGLSYDAAVAYWYQEGQPDRMDEDLNGIPCETVYSAGEIDAFFG